MNEGTNLSYTCPKCGHYMTNTTNADIDHHRNWHQMDERLKAMPNLV